MAGAKTIEGIRRQQHANTDRGAYLPTPEGCTEPALGCCYPDDDQPSEFYCCTHAAENGFCWLCGTFCGGLESFEFFHPGLCDQCYDQIQHENGDGADDVCPRCHGEGFIIVSGYPDREDCPDCC